MADSSKDLQLRELKDMITDLKQMIKTLQATVDAANKREEALIQERDNLKDEIALLRKKLFGSSSEKSPVDFPGQLNLFNEAEMEQIWLPSKLRNSQIHLLYPQQKSVKPEPQMQTVLKESQSPADTLIFQMRKKSVLFVIPH